MAESYKQVKGNGFPNLVDGKTTTLVMLCCQTIHLKNKI